MNKVFSWIGARLAEASTWVGLSTAVLAVGQISNMHEAPAIAHAITASSGSFTSGNTTAGAVSLLAALAGIFIHEKKG